MPKLKTLIIIAIVGSILIALLQIVFPGRTPPQTATPSMEPSSTEHPPTEPPSPPTERPQVIAVVTEITACYSSEPEFQLSVSEHVDVGIFERSENGELVQVQVNEKVDCWLPLRSLELNGRDLDAVPVALFVPTLPTIEVTPSREPPTAQSTPPPPLAVTWDMLSYDCGNGSRAIGATIDLIVEGGVLDHQFSRNVPIYARPGEFLSITVSSNTEDGEPSRIIQFTVPEGSDRNVYKCVRTGNIDDKENTAAPAESVCYDKRGNKVPCNPDRDPEK